MLQQVMKVGSILLIISTCLSAMERPTLKELAIKRVADLIIRNPDPIYCIKAFNVLPNDMSDAVVQQLVATDIPKSALPVVLLSYKLYQQQQLDRKQYQLRLLLANNHQVELAPDQSDQLIQASVTIQSIIQDIEEQIEEIPLPLLTQEQVTVLLSYTPIINALNISNSTLPMLQQEMPETTALSSYYFKYTALQQLKEHLTAQTVSTLCDLIIAASYLDIQSDQQNINFIELATCALGNKLLQSPQYQERYNVISTLPANVQYMLVQYLIDNSAVRYTLCGNSTNVIENTAQILTDHTDRVRSLSWSPNGKYIASGSHDKTIKIWNAQSSTCIRTLTGHTAWVDSVSWSPDGKHVASSSWDKTVRIWDASTGTCICTLKGHTKDINSVSWSPDGKHIASGSWDETVKIWDATNSTCIHTLTGHIGWVYSVVWSPDGKHVASNSNNTVKVWDTITGTCIQTLEGHTGCIHSVEWSPDGKYIASHSGDHTIRIWDATTSICIGILKSHSHRIIVVSWSPDSKHIASSSWDETVKIWDVTTGKCIHDLIGHTDWITSLSWSPDGKYIASGSDDNTIRIWNIIDKQRDHYLKAALSWEQALLLVHIIDKQRDHYLKAALSWEQALLLVHIINAHSNQQDIDFTHDTRALSCYKSLDQQVKQLVEPLLSERTRSVLHATKNLDRLIRANPVRAALFGVGLQIGRTASLRK